MLYATILFIQKFKMIKNVNTNILHVTKIFIFQINTDLSIPQIILLKQYHGFHKIFSSTIIILHSVSVFTVFFNQMNAALESIRNFF